MTDNKHKGYITEVECILAFMRRGYTVLLPYGDNEQYDFAVDLDGSIIRVQVKYASSCDGGRSFKIDCRRTRFINGKRIHSTYTSDSTDYLMTAWNGDAFLIPVDECGAVKILRVAPAANKQQQNVNWASDYQIDKMLPIITRRE